MSKYIGKVIITLEDGTLVTEHELTPEQIVDALVLALVGSRLETLDHRIGRIEDRVSTAPSAVKRAKGAPKKIKIKTKDGELNLEKFEKPEKTGKRKYTKKADKEPTDATRGQAVTKGHYSMEDRMKAVARVANGETVKDVAKDLGVSYFTVYTWTKSKMVPLERTYLSEKNWKAVKDSDPLEDKAELAAKYEVPETEVDKALDTSTYDEYRRRE